MGINSYRAATSDGTAESNSSQHQGLRSLQDEALRLLPNWKTSFQPEEAGGHSKLGVSDVPGKVRDEANISKLSPALKSQFGELTLLTAAPGEKSETAGSKIESSRFTLPRTAPELLEMAADMVAKRLLTDQFLVNLVKSSAVNTSGEKTGLEESADSMRQAALLLLLKYGSKPGELLKEALKDYDKSIPAHGDDGYDVLHGIHRKLVNGRRADRPPSPLAGHELGAEPGYNRLLADVFKNTTFGVGTDHNAILDLSVSKAMAIAGLKPNEPVVVINVDAHSDLYVDRLNTNGSFGQTNIALWGNAILLANPNITDYYWVIPDEFGAGKLGQELYNGKGAGDPRLVGTDKDVDVYVSKDGKKVVYKQDLPEGDERKDYRVVHVHKRTMREMPDFKGKNVILTTDLDYFDNSGFQTYRGAKVNTPPTDAAFAKYIETLQDHNIRPFYHFTCFSPGFTREKDLDALSKFVAYVGKASRNGEPYNTVHHHNTDYPTNRSNWFGHKNTLSNNGITTETDSSNALKLLWQLWTCDAIAKAPDGRIITNKPNGKLDAAVKSAMSIYKCPKDDAVKIIQSFADKDGVVDVWRLQELIQTYSVLPNKTSVKRDELEGSKKR